MNKTINEEKIMQRRAVKLHFDDEDMDFNLMWVLGQSGCRWCRTRRVSERCLADQGPGKLGKRVDEGRAAA